MFVNKIINKARAIILQLFYNRSFYFCFGHKYDLIIYDDIFPHPVSGFRLEEFTVLLSAFKNSKILVNAEAYPVIGDNKNKHKQDCDVFFEEFPLLNKKLKKIGFTNNINSRLFYCVFISNIYKFIKILEKKEVKFVFTLYPGGGFQMYNQRSDFMLKRVLSSNMFQKVIVTQQITKDYLLKNNFCKESEIEFVFGGVVPQKSLVKNFSDKKYFGNKKTNLDICFCAAKYMPLGIDKGYDVFIETAHLLCKQHDFVNFHVIGGFDIHDIDVSGIKDKITFYGYQKFQDLENFFKKMDIVLSPNKPFKLGAGSFDGFPLGAVVEAALNGVLVIQSDALKQNQYFIDEEDIFIVESDGTKITELINNLILNSNKIEIIAKRGALKFQSVYCNENQMKRRINLLNNLIEND